MIAPVISRSALAFTFTNKRTFELCGTGTAVILSIDGPADWNTALRTRNASSDSTITGSETVGSVPVTRRARSNKLGFLHKAFMLNSHAIADELPPYRVI
jgi:hypothetical protein